MKNFLSHFGVVLKYAIFWYLGINLISTVIYPITNSLFEKGDFVSILILVVIFWIVGEMTKKVIEYKGDGSELKDK